MRHIAKTLTYVYTPRGVAVVEAGETLPRDADPDRVARLVRAGAVEAVRRTRKPKDEQAD